MTRLASAHRFRRLRRAFTLIELLVVIGIIAMLSALTVISVGSIAKDARLATAQNTVVASLDFARALAMKENAYIAVAFRARWDTSDMRKRQVTEIVTAKWTGVSEIYTFGGGELEVRDRYEPLPSIPFRTLPAGIKVAGPWYDFPAQSGGGGVPVDLDNWWITQTEFGERVNSPVENAGRQFAVFFGPDGIVTTENPTSDAEKFYVDYNRDGRQNLTHNDQNLTTDSGSWWSYDHPDDECFLNPAPFLAVYDDDAAREGKISSWANGTVYAANLQRETGYIHRFGKRFHFNRYTGVVMTAEDQ